MGLYKNNTSTTSVTCASTSLYIIQNNYSITFFRICQINFSWHTKKRPQQKPRAC
nr:MAG TPA: hypothetical protein [Caudoviricetes sp.]